MIEQIATFFTIEMIYLWLNFGILPFWFILMFFPQSKICTIFVASIFPITILSGTYFYLIYFFFISDYEFLSNFNLYLGVESLKDLFQQDGFILLFWIHFISINLFLRLSLVLLRQYIIRHGHLQWMTLQKLF